MDVLITGVGNLLGFELALNLISRGYTVYGMDDLELGGFKKIRSIHKSPFFKFIYSGINLEAINALGKVDKVFHCEATLSPERFLSPEMRLKLVSNIALIADICNQFEVPLRFPRLEWSLEKDLDCYQIQDYLKLFDSNIFGNMKSFDIPGIEDGTILSMKDIPELKGDRLTRWRKQLDNINPKE